MRRLGLGLGGGLREAAVAWADCCEKAVLWLLSFFFFQKKQKNVKEEKEEERKVEIGFGQADNFPGHHKNMFVPRKTEWVRLHGLKSNAFEFNSNGLNKE